MARSARQAKATASSAVSVCLMGIFLLLLLLLLYMLLLLLCCGFLLNPFLLALMSTGWLQEPVFSCNSFVSSSLAPTNRHTHSSTQQQLCTLMQNAYLNVNKCLCVCISVYQLLIQFLTFVFLSARFILRLLHMHFHFIQIFRHAEANTR